MSKTVVPFSGAGAMANIIDTGSLTLPFENNIYLQSVMIAGMKHYIKDGILLIEGDKLKLKREPSNKYDEYAIEIYTDKAEKLGYIPRKNNKVFARLMDGGKLLLAEVRNVDYNFEKLDTVWIKIYLKDL